MFDRKIIYRIDSNAGQTEDTQQSDALYTAKSEQKTLIG